MKVNDFVKRAGEKLEVLKSSKGNLYFTCGDIWGKVAKDWESVPSEQLCISVCTDTETGDTFPMIHCPLERNSGKTPDAQTSCQRPATKRTGPMRKRVLLLAVSCKKGGLCPGGIDLDNPAEWIRIVRDDGQAGAVQGHEIDFAKPLDVIEFVGRPMPQGKQRENWVIDNRSCRKIATESMQRLFQAFEEYGYHGFWNNLRPFLSEEEFDKVTQPSESLLFVSDVRIYENDYGKAKIDFTWEKFSVRGVSMTDQDFYYQIDNEGICYKRAIVVISIPAYCDWTHPDTGEGRAYKFVSKVFVVDQKVANVSAGSTRKGTSGIFLDWNNVANEGDDLPF